MLGLDATRSVPTAPELVATRLMDSEDDERLGLDRAMAQLRDDGAHARPWEKASVMATLFGTPALPRTIGRYVVGERLGAGAMGEVHAAHDPGLDRPVAIKLLHPSPDHDADESRSRMLREAQTLAKLSHPHVVQVYEVGEIAGQVFIAMEFIRGRTLREWKDEQDPSWRQVLARYLEAGRGLAAVHGAGLVHRDFKPDNVLVGDDGRVCVADFGLARRMPASGSSEPITEGDPGSPAGRAHEAGARPPTTALTRASRVAGTPAYMAPEHLQGAAVDARADQFGFCVALYEGLYGRRPFAGQSLAALAASHASGPTPPPWRHEVPRRLWRALARGLAADPRDRFPSMEALLQALDPGRARRRRAATITALGVLALGVAETWGRALDPEPPALAEDAAPPSTTQAVATPHLAAARQALQRRDVALAMGVLREAPTAAAGERSGWMDTALQSLVAPLWVVAKLRSPRGDEASALAFSPDGTRLYAGTSDGRVHAWDPEAATVLDTFEAHGERVDGLWLDPRGDRLITRALAQHSARLWDLADGRMLADVRSDAEVELSHDGRWLATRNLPANRVLVWSVRTGEAVTEVQLRTPPLRVALDFERGRVLTTGDALQLWPLERGPATRTVPDVTELLALDSRGTTLVTSRSRAGSELVLRSPTSGRALHEPLPLPSRATALAFSPHGQTLATVHEDRTLRLWSVSPREGIAAVASASTGHHDVIRGLGFSPDGRWLATHAADEAIVVWDPTTATERARLHGRAVAFEPSGEGLATIEEDGAVARWRLNPGHRHAPPPDDRLLAVRPDGTGALVHDGTGRGALVLALGTSHPVVESRIDWPLELSPNAAGYAIHGRAGFDRDGERVVVACSRELWLYDLRQDAAAAAVRIDLHEDALEERYQGYAPHPTAFELAADGEVLVAGTRDGYVYLIDVARGRVVRSFGAHPDRIERLAISPDGSKVATASTGPTVRVWSLADGALLGALEGHSDVITALAFGAEDRIVTGSAEASVRLWEPSSGRVVSVLRGHERAVTSVAYRAHDGLVISTAQDHTLRLWDPEGSRPPIVLLHDGSMEAVSLVANDTKIVARGHDGTIWELDATLDEQAVAQRLWDATTVRPTDEQWERLGLGARAERGGG